MDTVYEMKSEFDLLGNEIDTNNVQWNTPDAGVGAGIDSYYEYLFKASILFNDDSLLEKFDVLYSAVKKYVIKNGLLMTVNMNDTSIIHYSIDSLSAYFVVLMVLVGDVEAAVECYEVYYALWQKYRALPERFDVRRSYPTVPVWPLRPEFIEATYHLWTATREYRYVDIAHQIANDLLRVKAKDLIDFRLGDRQESFFLAETLKYLYLILTPNHRIHSSSSRLGGIWSTEAHLFFLPQKYRNVAPSGNRTCGVYVNKGLRGAPTKQQRFVHSIIGDDDNTMKQSPAFLAVVRYRVTIENGGSCKYSLERKSEGTFISGCDLDLVLRPASFPDSNFLILERVNGIHVEGDVYLTSSKIIFQVMLVRQHCTDFEVCLKESSSVLSVKGQLGDFGNTLDNEWMILESETNDACEEIKTSSAAVLVKRGGCTFSKKILNIQKSNPNVRLVLISNTENFLIRMVKDKEPTHEVAAVCIRQNDGLSIYDWISRGGFVYIRKKKLKKYMQVNGIKVKNFFGYS